jgi:alkyl hydroperoxide reductase subunit AhpC
MMTSLGIGDQAPDFTADSTEGALHFHKWLGDSWAILFSHPKDFTPICTTELGYLAGMKPHFDRRGCKILGLSVDPVSDHVQWARDIRETQGHALNFPLIGDHDLKVAKLYGMLHPNAGDSAAGRKAADNATVRTVFVIGPDKAIKAHLAYPMSTGRNFEEVLRLLDSVQLTAKHKVATPVNWKRGEDVVIIPSVSDEEARKRFPGGWKAPKAYLRIVAEPA